MVKARFINDTHTVNVRSIGSATSHEQLIHRDLPEQHPIDAITGLRETLNSINGDIGDLSNLTTENKVNLVAAINEVDSHNDTNANHIANHVADKNNPHEVTKAQVGLGNVENIAPSDLPISTATQSALDLKLDSADLGNATLEIQKNGTTVGVFTANSKIDNTINLIVPTQASDINALPDTTKYGANLSLSINSSTFIVTAQLKDQNGNNLGSAQTIDLPLESVVVNGSYDSTNKKIILTLENGNTIDIPVADLVAGLQSEITVDNKLASDLVDDTNQTHKFATSTQLSQISTNTSDISNLQSGKADKATTLSGYGIADAYTKTEVDTALGGKQGVIDSSHKLDSDLVDDSGQTNKFVTSAEKAQITTNANNISSLQTNKADKSTTYTKTEVDTIANGKANVGLDNLNADGQMVVDSQNGTISNCILEIPQNIKLTLDNGLLTVKSGSELALCKNSTYTTRTLTQDYSRQFITSGWGTNKEVILCYWGSTGVNLTNYPISKISSGATTPESLTNENDLFFNTTDFTIYQWKNGSMNSTNYNYPLCILVNNNGSIEYAKDSNGNDMIFNGAGFIGQHIFLYPNVKGLAPNGRNDKGTLKNIKFTTSSLMIANTFNGNNIDIVINGNTLSSTTGATYYPDENYNRTVNGIWYVCFAGKIKRESGVITDFVFYQPYEGARNLLTDDIEEEVATKQVDVTTLTGYDSTQTQTLKNINGVLTWVTD